MIYLITGLPGNGKTLYTLWHIRDRAKQENRPVYVSGIPDLAITDWNQIDEDQARNWFDLPDGAIIVIDEAQRIFRPRPGRGEPPPHVAQLETHRHKGFDIYLITQHPRLIDQNVRRLAGTHRHVQRTFGLPRAVIHEWGEVRMNCELRRDDSSKTTWKFPKDVYKLYKSAEVHTHKVQMPKQVWYLLVLLALLVALAVFLKYRMSERIEGNGPGVEKPESAASLGPGFGAPPSDAPLTTEQYISSLTPRVPDLAYTAPRYDDVTKPTTAPFPVGCIQSGDACKCYTQQATIYKASADFCRNYVQHGVFQDWKPADLEKSQI